MTLEELRAAIRDPGKGGVDTLVEWVVTLGNVRIDTAPAGPTAIFAQLATVINNLNVLNVIRSKTQIHLTRMKGRFAVEQARAKIEYDQLFLNDQEVRAAPSKETRAILARAKCAPTLTKIAELKEEVAVFSGVHAVVESTHSNLVTAKEALSKQVAILELELQLTPGARRKWE